jgi:Putative stress-induced transcription regulator
MTSNRPPAFFVGEHLALDFLNTTATPQGTQVEWLGDGKDLERFTVGWRTREPLRKNPPVPPV